MLGLVVQWAPLKTTSNLEGIFIINPKYNYIFVSLLSYNLHISSKVSWDYHVSIIR
jgi:hypothetical protein